MEHNLFPNLIDTKYQQVFDSYIKPGSNFNAYPYES